MEWISVDNHLPSLHEYIWGLEIHKKEHWPEGYRIHGLRVTGFGMNLICQNNDGMGEGLQMWYFDTEDFKEKSPPTAQCIQFWVPLFVILPPSFQGSY